MENEKILVGVPYLEEADVVKGGVKPYVTNGKPVVMMVQAGYCGHCTTAKPAFQKFADSAKNVTVVTIQADGRGGEAVKAFQVPGYPAYLGFNKNGQLVKAHDGNRDVASLKQFAQSL